MSENILNSFIAISVLSVLGSIGFNRVYRGENRILRRFDFILFVFLFLFTATFSSVKGYDPLDKVEAFIGDNLGAFFGWEIANRNEQIEIDEPSEQPWAYTSGRDISAFATKSDLVSAMVIISCEKRNDTPFLAFGLYLPDFMDQQRVFLNQFQTEHDEKGFVELEFRLDSSMRFPLELTPMSMDFVDAEGTSIGWNANHDLETSQANKAILDDLLHSMLSRNSTLQIYSRPLQEFIPFAVNTHGLRFLFQNTNIDRGCRQSLFGASQPK